MPVIKLYPHGLTAGTPPGKNDHLRGLRGNVQGWSNSSTRSNTRFLYSVEPGSLTGHGYALSLTLKDCPPSATDFHRIRMAFNHRLRRMGLIRMHWLIEWQRRRVPHLHAAAWFRRDNLRVPLVEQWCEVAEIYGARWQGQHVEPIYDDVGWFQYLSKHAARGLSHYQRSIEKIPKGWTSGTGRMWGRLGVWQTRDPARLQLENETLFRFRRLVRGWRKGKARRAMKQAQPSGDLVAYPADFWKAVRSLAASRRMLKANTRELGELRGISEWIDMDTALTLIAWLARTGGKLRSV